MKAVEHARLAMLRQFCESTASAVYGAARAVIELEADSAEPSEQIGELHLALVKLGTGLRQVSERLDKIMADSPAIPDASVLQDGGDSRLSSRVS